MLAAIDPHTYNVSVSLIERNPQQIIVTVSNNGDRIIRGVAGVLKVKDPSGNELETLNIQTSRTVLPGMSADSVVIEKFDKQKPNDASFLTDGLDELKQQWIPTAVYPARQHDGVSH